MHTILAAIASIAKTIGNAIKKCFIAIKNVLIKIFKPIAHFLFLLCKGIYRIFKYFILYIFIKPILFLYHYVVVPIGRGLRFLLTRIYKYILLPPLRGIAFIGKKIGKFFVLLYHKILIPIGHFFAVIFKTIGKGIDFVCREIVQFLTIIF